MVPCFLGRVCPVLPGGFLGSASDPVRIPRRELKPGDIIRFTDPAAPDMQVVTTPEQGDGYWFCSVRMIRRGGLSRSGEFTFEFPPDGPDFRVVYRARDNPEEPDDIYGDVMSCLELYADFQAFVTAAPSGSLPGEVLALASRLNRLASRFT
jgi:hypothetical protein